MINGVTQIVVTKLDVLDHFEEVKIGSHYSIEGEQTDELPYDLTTKEIKARRTAGHGYKIYLYRSRKKKFNR